ncbi:MAG: hypothetical protein F4226_02025 [Synechococcus sp. SB0678_bin_12]|nr:hypothetical protein [Synechococcus sp. SB0678_bin_12]MYI88338.1 hypothetical protein [Synechococcus sp. SB0672_bin_10]
MAASPPERAVTLAGEERTNATPLAENQEVLAKVLGFQTITPQQVAAGSAFSFSPQPAAEQGQGAPPACRLGAVRALPLPWATRQHHLP